MTLFTLFFALVSSPAALAGETIVDVFGGDRNVSTGDDAYKLDTYRVTTSVHLREIAPHLDSDAGAEVIYVVYVEDETTAGLWHLLWQSVPVGLPGGADFHGSPPLEMPLFAGETYALGVYLTNDPVSYGYDDTIGSETVAWGVREGAIFSQNGSTASVLPGIDQTASGFGYYQQITVSLPEDLDEDGFDDVVDCNDVDPLVHPGAEEICNGIDDDCDGRLSDEESVDTDGDGAADCMDCERLDPEVYPGAEEPECSEVDLDCDGVAGDPDACDGNPDTDDEAITGARCSAVPSSLTGLVLLGGLAPLLRRRRR